MKTWKHKEYHTKDLFSQSESSSDSNDDEPANKCPQSHTHENRINKNKYKTELCKNFSETGWCPYEDRCQYAHGYNDCSLNMFIQNKKAAYKTKRCKSFWNEGKCNYGKRCQFSHYEPQSTDKICLSLHLYLL